MVARAIVEDIKEALDPRKHPWRSILLLIAAIAICLAAAGIWFAIAVPVALIAILLVEYKLFAKWYVRFSQILTNKNWGLMKELALKAGLIFIFFIIGSLIAPYITAAIGIASVGAAPFLVFLIISMAIPLIIDSSAKLLYKVHSNHSRPDAGVGRGCGESDGVNVDLIVVEDRMALEEMYSPPGQSDGFKFTAYSGEAHRMDGMATYAEKNDTGSGKDRTHEGQPSGDCGGNDASYAQYLGALGIMPDPNAGGAASAPSPAPSPVAALEESSYECPGATIAVKD